MTELVLATVSTASSSQAFLIIDGETEPTTKGYTFLESYAPRKNDRVLCAVIGDQYVVLGKIHITGG